jgi:hypothetical protein
MTETENKMDHFTHEQLAELIEKLTVETKIADKIFQIEPHKCCLAYIERAIVYGIRRDLNDPIGGLDDKTKIDTISLKLGEIYAGTWTPGKTRVVATDEEKWRRNAAKSILDGESLKKLDALSKEEEAKKLDALWAMDGQTLGADVRQAMDGHYAESERRARKPKTTRVSLGALGI